MDVTRQELLEIADTLSRLAERLASAAECEGRLGSTYLNSRQAALLVPCASGDAFRAWAKRHGVVGVRRGRSLYYDRRDIEAARAGGLE